MASTDFNIGGVEGQIASLSSQVTALNTQIANKVKSYSLTKTVNDGYFSISNDDIPSTYAIVAIQNVYRSGTPLNLIYTLQARTVYVRTGTGSDPTNGTTVIVNAIAIKS